MRKIKVLVCFSLLAVSVWLCTEKINISKLPVSDYAAYWTASRLMITGHNPYDSEQVLAIEQSVGWKKPMPLVMRNPPWALPFVVPLGLCSFSLSRVLWLLPQAGILVVSTIWLWRIYGGTASQKWLAWLVCATFLPAAWVLAIGQITPFILLGVVGFLYCEREGLADSWPQAASLVLVAFKPQLLYLFWIALLIWVAHTRRWKILLRFAALLAAATMLALPFDWKILAEYLHYLKSTPVLSEPVPTIGNLLRLGTNLPLARFLPMFVGTGWAVWYWTRHREGWNWTQQMPALLLASLVTTSYSWFFDQVVLLPAIICVLAQNLPNRNRVLSFLPLFFYMSVNAGVLLSFYLGARLTNFGLVWAASSWCLFSLTVRYLNRRSHRISLSAEASDRSRSRTTLPRLIQAHMRTLKYFTCFALLCLACWISLKKLDLSQALVSDYAAYWSADRLLITGQNPYDPVKVFALEKTVGRVSVPLVMRNPPWAFGIVLPFGLLSYKLSRILWTLPEILALILCASWIWKRYTTSASSRWVAWLIASTFIPALWVLIMGQITPFILLGVVGFLFCEATDRANSWLQAACLVLIALKPQLLYLFWFALILSALWALRDLDRATRDLRRWLLFLRFGFLLLAFSGIALIFNPRVFADYFTYLRNTPILLEVIPTFGNLLRIQTNLPWTQFAPMFLGCGWAVWRWVKMRDNWNWEEQMPALLLASVLTTTYSWFYDQIVLLPALLYAAAQNFPSRNRIHSASVVALFLAVNAGVTTLFVQGQKLTNFNLLWSAPAWCALFVAMQWLAKKKKQEVLELVPVKPAEPEEPVNYASNLAA